MRAGDGGNRDRVGGQSADTIASGTATRRSALYYSVMITIPGRRIYLLTHSQPTVETIPRPILATSPPQHCLFESRPSTNLSTTPHIPAIS